MSNKVIVRHISVTEFIKVLKHFEKKGKKYINLECVINEVQDDVRVFTYKKTDMISNKVKFTNNTLEELLKHT